MAKQKDHGDLLEIFYDKDRDTLSKFQKIIRKVVLSEKKDISIDMSDSPTLDKDYLSSFVYGAQGLRSYGKTITFYLSPINYSILKTSPDSNYFNLEIAQSISEEEPIPVESSATLKNLPQKTQTTENNIIHLSNDEDIANLGQQIENIVQQNAKEVIIDLTKIFLITPKLVQSLILESINASVSLRIQILPYMQKIFKSNPQAVMLNLEVVQKQAPMFEFEDEKSTGGAEFVGGGAEFVGGGAEFVGGGAEFLGGDTEFLGKEKEFDEPFFPKIKPATPTMDVSNNTINAIPAEEVPAEEVPVEEVPEEEIEEDVVLPERDRFDFDDSPSAFEIKVNALYANPMKESAFLRDFDAYFQKLRKTAGARMYIDMREYERLEPAVAIKLLYAHYDALAHNVKLTIRLLKDQNRTFADYMIKVEELEHEVDNTPRFIIEGSRLDLVNITMPMFLEKFSENFHKLMESGHTNLVVDISKLIDFNSQVIDLIVLCYLEAIGRGFKLTIRIRPDMEESFVTSGRGHALPIEIITPNLKAKVDIETKVAKPRIDMSKIRHAMENDKLTNKVLEHQYETVHIESRGTIHNWEPIPKKQDTVVEYTGIERRVEKRYQSENLEVIFARGALSKISGRRYPVKNLSLTGCQFISPVTLSKSEPVRMKIYLEDLCAELSTHVKWCKPVPAQALFQVGVEFVKIGEVSKIQLKEILRNISSPEPNPVKK